MANNEKCLGPPLQLGYALLNRFEKLFPQVFIRGPLFNQVNPFG
jgi:hypothetical protein